MKLMHRSDALTYQNMSAGEFLPGIELLSQGATPPLSSPLLRFTAEFEMDRCGTTALWTPGYSRSQGEP